MGIMLELMPWIWGIIVAIGLFITLKLKDLDALWFLISAFISLTLSLIFPNLSLLWQLSIFITTTLVLLLTVGKFTKKDSEIKIYL